MYYKAYSTPEVKIIVLEAEIERYNTRHRPSMKTPQTLRGRDAF
jgi:hypothetical protein